MDLMANIKTTSVCLVCCKTVDKSQINLTDPRNRHDYQFFNFLEKHFGTCSTFTDIIRKIKEVFLVNSKGETESLMCHDCDGLAKIICDLYHQLKCTELQIHHKVSTLVRIMKEATKAPSRMTKIRETFGDERKTENFIQARRELHRKCSKQISKCGPRVSLQKIAGLTPPKLETVTDESNYDNEGSSVLADQLVITKSMEPVITDQDHISVEDFNHFDLCEDNDNQNDENAQVEQKIIPVEQNDNEQVGSELMVDIYSPRETTLEAISADNDDQGNDVSNCKIEPIAVKPNSTRKRKTDTKNVISTKYLCKLCCQSFTSYALYLSHRKSKCHTRRLYRSYLSEDKLVNDMRSSSGAEKQVSQETSRYQLRPPSSKRQKYNNFKSKCSSSESSSSSDDEDKDSVANVNSSSSSSYSESESECFNDNTKTQRQHGTKGCFSCPVKGCKYVAKSEWLFKMHQQFHKPGKYACTFCEKTSNTAYSLAIHEKRKHSVKVHKKLKWKMKSGSTKSKVHRCARCPYQVSMLGSYIHHFASEHLKLPWIKSQRCSICQVPVDLRLAKHHFHYYHDTTNVDPSKIFKCKRPDCTAYFTKFYGLRVHISRIHNLRTAFDTKTEVECTASNCSIKLENADDLTIHLTLHGEFKCEFCDTVETYAPDLAIHETTAHKLGKFQLWKYKCQRCNFHTDNQKLYTDHHLESHLSLSNKQPCQICGLNKNAFNDHTLRFHTSNQRGPKVNTNKAFVKQCDQCPAYFIHDWQLRFHKQQQHTKLETPEYPCKIANCKATFKFPLELQYHESLHETLPCRFCSEKFDFAENLATHELKHVSENQADSNTLNCPRCLQCFAGVKVFVEHFVNSHLFLTPETHICSICELVSQNNKLLKLHKTKQHVSESANFDFDSLHYQCSRCPAYFKSKFYLEAHVKETHQDDVIKCDLCKLKFETVESLEIHKKLHGKFNCQTCNVEKNYARDLAIHEVLQHGKVKDVEKSSHIFTCARCSHTPFTQLGRYVRHFIEAHLELFVKNLSCNICQAMFHDNLSLQGHKNMFHNVKDMKSDQISKCDECPAYFRTVLQLTRHRLKVHKLKKGVECKVCGKRYLSIKSLNMHKPIHDPPDTWRFVCPASGCTEKFPDSNLLVKHMRAHSKSEYQFVCDVPNCGKRCPSEQDLESHKKYYTSLAHYNASGSKVSIAKWKREQVCCEICGMEVTRMKISAHITLKHVKDPPPRRPTREFKCDKCDKSFKKKVQLQAHREYHKGPDEWKWMCAVCSKRCTTKQKLEEHTRTHTKEKPFVCQICGEKYAHRHNLRNHVNAKHKDAGEQDTPRPINHRNFVSRKGKKLKGEFCFTKEQDQQND